MLALAWALSAALAAPADAPPIAIPYEELRLDNGLQVLLCEDHSVPFVWVDVWYHVGSKDEPQGRKGFAHLFEHLMFQGSEHMPDDYFVPLQKVGARINGSTNLDRTNYYEGLPARYLPLALWLESDRMGWLLGAVDEQRLRNQKDVVRNERRQRYENRPYGRVWMWLLENLYPEGHPYHTPTIGLHEDIEAATLDDVRDFFRTYYAPNNATLAICGDFDPEVARELVERTFGDIPRGPEPPALEVAPAALEGEKVVRKTDRVPHPKVWIAWLSPALFAPGDADLDVLATVLADGKDSRLYRELVERRRIAKDVSAYQWSASLQGQFIVEATAAPGHTTDELVAAIDEVLDELRRDGPTEDEVATARTTTKVAFFRGLRTISGKADQLASYAVLAGDPGYVDEDLARYEAVTAASAHEAARRWLPPDRRVVLHVVPEEEAPDSGQGAPEAGEEAR